MKKKKLETTSYWLKTIEDKEIREKALNNYKNCFAGYGLDVLDDKDEDKDEPSFNSALSGAFVWSDTPEGFYFWNNFVNTLND